MSIKFTASTVLNYSPRKARLVINTIRGLTLAEALEILKTLGKGKTKKVYNLLVSAASNLKIAENEYSNYKISTIIAEEAQKLYRVVPRARGSAFKIRRRYSRIKVLLEQK
jgi:large subunit ribosomal protein L22